MTARERRRSLLRPDNGIDDTDSVLPSAWEQNRTEPLPETRIILGRKPQVGLRGSCECGNGDISQFRKYLYDGELHGVQRTKCELHGVQCKKCEKEYLRKRFTSQDPQIIVDGVDLCQYPVTLETDDAAHQVKARRTLLEKTSASSKIGQGDHISWHRPMKGIWHHAIVVETFSDNKAKVIHLTKRNDEIGVYESIINLNEEDGDMYLMVYSDKEKEFNPRKLVIARAKSMVGVRGYNLFTKNCEHFATFCKVGLKRSQQICWLKRKFINFVGAEATSDAAKIIARATAKAVIKKGTEISAAELIEKVAKGSNWLGAAIVALWEVGTFAYDVYQLNRSYKDGKLSKQEFKRSVAQRAVEGILKGGFMIGGSLLGELIGSLGGTVGALLGSILGGFLGGLIGTIIALPLAPLIARLIFPARADE